MDDFLLNMFKAIITFCLSLFGILLSVYALLEVSKVLAYVNWYGYQLLLVNILKYLFVLVGIMAALAPNPKKK
jgi:hypothetical protein